MHGQAVAADEFEVVRGQMLAEAYCAECHAIGPQGDSPHEAAPPFRTLAERLPIDSLADRLAEGVIADHPDMPEVIMLPTQINDFLAYLDSVQTVP